MNKKPMIPLVGTGEGPVLSRLAALVLIVAAFAVGTVVNSYLPNLETIMVRPFPLSASLDKPVQMRSGALTVSKPQLTRAVNYRGNPVLTEHAFVVATLHLEPSGESAGVSEVTVLGGDGKVYGGMQRGGVNPQCVGSQPGISITCTIFIEVQPESVAGARLQVRNYGSVLGDEVVTVPLQLDAQKLGQKTDLSQLDQVPEVGTRKFGGGASA